MRKAFGGPCLVLACLTSELGRSSVCHFTRKGGFADAFRVLFFSPLLLSPSEAPSGLVICFLNAHLQPALMGGIAAAMCRGRSALAISTHASSGEKNSQLEVCCVKCRLTFWHVGHDGTWVVAIEMELTAFQAETFDSRRFSALSSGFHV